MQWIRQTTLNLPKVLTCFSEVLEITTGGQRIHDYNELLEKMKRYHMEEGDLGAYTDIFKYGMPPHGGLGIGLERVVMKMLGLANIREASLFPRDIHHLDP